MITSGIWSKYQLACQETPNEQNGGKKNGKGKNSQWFGVIHRHWNNCGLYAKEIKWKDGNITQELECMLKTNGNPKNGKNKIAN